MTSSRTQFNSMMLREPPLNMAVQRITDFGVNVFLACSVHLCGEFVGWSVVGEDIQECLFTRRKSIRNFAVTPYGKYASCKAHEVSDVLLDCATSGDAQ